MKRIETREQYDLAVARVEELLPLVDDNTPITDTRLIELKSLSDIVANYSEEYFAL